MFNDPYRSLRIAVVSGGHSAEHEVSRSSAKSVISALQASFDDVTSLELDTQLARTLLAKSFDVVFPVLHGSPGEDGTLQGFLELQNYNYVGSGVRASASAMHKPTAKLLFAEHGLPIVPGITVNARDSISGSIERITAVTGDDVVVKPCGQGSAIGVGFAKGKQAIRSALESAFQYGSEVVVERRVAGREITSGVLEYSDGTILTLPIVEVITPEGFWYDYEHRYTQGLSEHVVPVDLPCEVEETCRAIGLGAHQALGCRDLSRTDMVVTNDNKVYIFETNTLPGMTPTSLYPDAAKAAGISFEELVKQLVLNAWQRRNK